MIAIPWLAAFALQADGWWLRSDIIWHKKNPMPGSYKDRPTTAHEYLFLLSKSKRYYYDHEAIKEPASHNTHARLARAHGGYAPPGQDKHEGALAPRQNRKNLPEGQVNLAGYRDAQRAGVNPKARIPSGWDTRNGSHREKLGRYARFNVKQNESFTAATSGKVVENRNKRSVWTIATAPYPKAHFATFPPALVEPCILAGSRSGDIVLDPFGGSGTVGEVAQRLGRQWILIDISPDYASMQRERTIQPGLEL